MESSEESRKKLRHIAVSLREARGIDNSPTLLTVFLPANADVKSWEQKLGSRPQSRTSRDGDYMQNLSKRGEHWPQFEGVARETQRLFRQVVHENGGRLPKNGLVMFTGSADRRMNIAFEPPSAVLAPVHLCDAKFRVEYLSSFMCDQVYGFIIVDGSGCLLGTLSGQEKKVKDTFSVNLPNKHSKGGQSALRFARQRLEKRHRFLVKVAEQATTCFISDDTPNISGLIIAGAAEFKNDLASRNLLDARLQALVLATLDISYGGESGFNQAISQAADIFKGLDFVREKCVISNFLGEIAKDTGMYCFGMQDTMAALEMGAVETLIVWDELSVQRLVLKDIVTDTQEVVFVDPDKGASSGLHPFVHGAELQVQESSRFLDWIVENHGSFGAKLQFITDQSPEGTQFCKGFGGVGGLLRYSLEFESTDDPDDNVPSDSDSDFA